MPKIWYCLIPPSRPSRRPLTPPVRERGPLHGAGLHAFPPQNSDSFHSLNKHEHTCAHIGAHTALHSRRPGGGFRSVGPEQHAQPLGLQTHSVCVR